MTARPTAVLAMHPELTRGMVAAEHLARLRAHCDVPDPEPLAAFEEGRASELLARADVLLTGWGCPPLAKAVLDRAPRLRLVAHAAGTVKHHVTEACFARGVRVTSAAAANAVPVAEYALAAILLANKRAFRLQRRYAELRAGRLWPREVPIPGNHRRVIGIVGASRTGRKLMELLRAFDFEVLVHDPYLAQDEAASLGATSVELEELLRRAHVVSLHAPELPATRGMLGARQLSLLRDGAVLVNTARGSLVDGEALVSELASGRIDAVLDVTEPEVLPPDSPLYELPNVFLTPHIAGAMGLETARLVELALDEIARFARGEPLEHEIRAEDWERIA